jgi:uroporphyrin-III C-methyltransferase
MNPTPGTVYLVGAGPGDPELITVRGLRILRAADVVLHDNLIAAELLDELRPAAEILDVGKRPGYKRYEQEEINDLLVDRARRGLVVVRLKGGDPFVFGRGGEEVLACREAGIPVCVIPGVTSAFAVPAAAGIPVTHRGLSRTCAIVTAVADPRLGDAHLPYDSLARIDTVVILMGLSALAEVAAQLIDAGRTPDTPVACVQAGWTPQQRVILGTLSTIGDRVEAAGLRSPVTTIVGEVARFAETATAALTSLPALESLG